MRIVQKNWFEIAPTASWICVYIDGAKSMTIRHLTICSHRGAILQRRNIAVINMEADMDNSSTKPLAATLMQEFQNLKDKFKSEDDGIDRGAIGEKHL